MTTEQFYYLLLVIFSFVGFGDGLGDMVAENRAKAASPDAASDAR